MLNPVGDGERLCAGNHICRCACLGRGLVVTDPDVVGAAFLLGAQVGTFSKALQTRTRGASPQRQYRAMVGYLKPLVREPAVFQHLFHPPDRAVAPASPDVPRDLPTAQPGSVTFRVRTSGGTGAGCCKGW